MKLFQAIAPLAAIVLTVTVQHPARARDEAQIKRDCTADALTYCYAAIPFGRRSIIKCMVKNRKNLSQQCLQHIHD